LAIPLLLADVCLLAYLPAYYAEEMTLQVGLVGVVFLMTRFCDALLDLLVGWLSDKTRSRSGRRKPWVLIGTPMLMLAAWFLCNPPRGAGLLYLSIWAMAFYAAHTAIKIPYWSWGGEFTTDYVERSRVTTFREVGTMIGVMFGATAPLVFLPDNPSLRSVLHVLSMSIIGWTAVTALLIALFVKDSQPPMEATPRFVDGVHSLARNKVMLRFCLAMGLVNLGFGAINSVAVFVVNIGLNLPGKIFLLTVIQYVVALSVAPWLIRLTRHIDKHVLLMGSLLVIVAAFTWGALFIPGEAALLAAVCIWILMGVGFAGFFAIPLSMLADIVDYGAVQTGQRLFGTYVAAYNCTTKIGMALGVGVAFGLLGLLSFHPNATPHTAADALSIRVVGFGLTAVLFLPAIALLWNFPISRQAQAHYRQELEDRGPDESSPTSSGTCTSLASEH